MKHYSTFWIPSLVLIRKPRNNRIRTWNQVSSIIFDTYFYYVFVIAIRWFKCYRYLKLSISIFIKLCFPFCIKLFFWLPITTIITVIPIDFIKLDLPTAFVPYNSIPSVLSIPNETLFGTYNSFWLMCSIKGCLISVAFKYDFSAFFMTGLQYLNFLAIKAFVIIKSIIPVNLIIILISLMYSFNFDKKSL